MTMLMDERVIKEIVVKVRAGTMTLKDGVVFPNMERGFLCLLRCSILRRFELGWFTIEGEERLHVMLPPGRVAVSWVKQCTTGRVMLFDIDHGKHLYFFWIQLASTEYDESIMRQIQQFLSKHERFSAVRRPPGILMSTMQSILAEIREESAAADLDLSELLGSSSLINTIMEDPWFYVSRLRPFMPEEDQAKLHATNIFQLLQSPSVKWTAHLMGIILRSTEGHRSLSREFLLDNRKWKACVLTFLSRVLQYVRLSQGGEEGEE